MSLFDLNELKQKPREPSGYSALEKFLLEHQEAVKSIKELVGKTPNEGEAYFIWSLNSFNAFTFIPYLVEIHGGIQELVISTYGVNMRIADALLRHIQNGTVEQIEMLIADSLKFRMPKVVDHLKAICENHPQITVKYAWNHSKVMLARCGNQHYVIEGSGNFSENARNEQYIFYQSQRIYEFRKQCIQSAIER
ncbi:MAG: hypothetical protein LAT81_08840 [Oceanicaulis sp.]|nr:hypothetical protein [Oceanicaulis sp.]